jgi:transcriptional regulator with XRE-family HTH domain
MSSRTAVFRPRIAQLLPCINPVVLASLKRERSDVTTAPVDVFDDISWLGCAMDEIANHALRDALSAQSLSTDAVAELVGVDSRTVQRWVRGRIPHARHRWAVASALGMPERRLWPSAPGEDRVRVQMVSGYRQRADLPGEEWMQLFDAASHNIDLLGIALLFLPEQNPGLGELLWRKAAGGCTVRLCLADPRSPFLPLAEPEESQSELLQARIRTAVAQFRRTAEAPGLQVRLHDLPVYNSIFRFDDELLVATHLYATPGHRAPLIRLARRPEAGMFESFMDHFQRVWGQSRHLAGRPTVEGRRTRSRPLAPGQLALLTDT